MSLRITTEEYSALLARTGQASSLPPTTPPSKPNKFGAIRKTIDGISFASTGEANRYQELVLELKAGSIAELSTQVRFPCAVNGLTVCVYVADFVYWRDGQRVIEDFKGFRTPEYRLKKKLVEALYGIKITETGVKRRRRK